MYSKFIVAALLISTTAAAQQELPKDWHVKDLKESGIYGISLDKAYSFIKSKKLKSKTVIVGVIDSGIDTLHEDLKPILWTNPKEIPGNGIDDDKNGYIDDIHGWNFIGGKDGRNVKENSLEVTRVYHAGKSKFEGKEESNFTGADLTEFKIWKKAEKKTLGEEEGGVDIVGLRKLKTNINRGDSILQIALAKEIYTGKDLEGYTPKTDAEKKAKATIYGLMKGNDQLDATNNSFLGEVNDYVAGEERKEEAKTTPPVDNRKEIVQDDETNFNDRNYGNNDLMASTPFHGTHCSGIIAAVRNNNIGMDGIADNVRIMMVRAVPDGDEHDKDIALAIRYAVDNGAQVLSMSFGKDFSPQKQWVDEAFKYAESKGVLLVHAAGNDHKNVDSEDNFPSALFLDGKTRPNNVLTVGASGDLKNGGLTASFSNYGKAEVDVFAPGVQIYSTIPGGNTYGKASGTSMACPVTAGIAALLLEYYPTLSARQIKSIIEKSAQQPTDKVNKPGTDEKVNLSDLSRTGGLVNAYEAIKLASTIKGERKIKKEVLPKPKLVNSKKG